MKLNTQRSFVSITVAVLLAASAPIALAQHDEHQYPTAATTQPTEPAGDPYPLDIDPVTMEKLPALDEQIIIDHEGRELRFGSTESVEAFKKNPDRYLAAIDGLIIKQQLPYYPLKNCVVLGGLFITEMGGPIDYVYNNRHFRFCCKMCRTHVNNRPAFYLGKLDEAVKQLQMADYPLATCPVSGGQLGAMGDPIDVVIANRLVRLCCDGCIDKLRADPMRYLGMLGEVGVEHAGHEVGEHHTKPDTSDENKGHGQADHGHDGH